ncbi:hypothetical protein HO173_001434 [Letharia columbiana]|uniref:Uncharacterized protein n=1 Tax=Letharia columbiana TaxID=112416 RepID=A0A8H6G5H0_9LECA|nr:uncharacterized protein HO173_001434 [Letharia columbiana]KAF6240761.1 hypothetical protein HO173_001434 [Letharia columbiana]
MHCGNLDQMRCCVIQEKLGYWKERRRKRHTSKVAPAGPAVGCGQKRYGERAKNRALARDLERLIEECETLLQRQKGGVFPAIDWRPFTSRKRWPDGERGWMGVMEDEVRSADVVGVGGGDVRSKKKKEKEKKKKKVPTDIAKAVLRTRFATCFPRAADKRACAGDGDRGT